MAVSTKVTLFHRLEDFATGAILNHYGRKPLEDASAAGADLAERLGPLTGAHQTALRNLALAFPEKSASERAEIARLMWRGLGRTLGEFPHLGEVNAYSEDSRIAVQGVELLDAIRESGKGAVFISGHFSNWELMVVAIVQRALVCQVTYRPANNPLIDKRIIKQRSAYGAKLQAAKGREGGMGLLRALAKGETVALMNDQKYNEGVAAPFFGYPAMTADGPTRLALRFGVPLVPFSLRRLGESVQFELCVHEPIPLDYSAPPDQVIPACVARINAFVEAHVRAAPEQWFWVHRRWPREAWEQAGLVKPRRDGASA